VKLALWMLPPALLAAATAAASPPGDARRGAEIYERCQACHALARNRTGPKHCGLLGRPAGTAPGFHGYSEALKDSGIVWDRESLDRFLADPLATVPGTRMGYAGVKDSQERADLIAFLAAAGPCNE
jgi:cytochrome c